MAYEITNHNRFYRKEILAGEQHILPVSRSNPISVGTIPGSGGTMLVEYSLAPSNTPDNEKNWREWEWGTSTDPLDDVLIGPVGELRITATDANGVVEIVFGRN